MKTYKITGKTNGWIAQRDSLFKSKEYIAIEKGLTLKEAQKKILDFYNEDYGTYFKNWGLVRCNNQSTWSNEDGTRGYEYDGRYFAIEEEVEPSVWRVEDTETGNYVIYIGSDKEAAIEAIFEDDEPELWDLYGDEERVWCGKFDTIYELKELSK